MDETPENRQNNEFSALKSIYGDDLEDLRTGSEWKPLDILLHLKPQQGSTREIYVRVDLHVSCSSQYPNVIPHNISLKNYKGLALSLVQQLQQELSELAHKKKGMEIVYELCLKIEEFLHKNNKPPKKSFHDQMLQRIEQEEIQNQQERKIEEDEQGKILREEVKRRVSTLEEVSRPRRKSNSVTDEDRLRDSPSTDRRKISSNGGGGDTVCSHKPSDDIFFENSGSRQIIRGNCLGHANAYSSIFSGIDKKTGEYIIINEWKMPMANVDKLQVNRQLQLIEREFKSNKSIKHENLTSFLDFSWEIVDDCFVVRIQKEFINGICCRSLFVNTNIKADIPFIKHIVNGVLKALECLHKKDVIHRDVKDSCIYINREGMVKLSDFNLYRKLTDLFNITSASTYGKKTDVYKLGKFIVGLIQGISINEDDTVSIPDYVPQDLYDFLKKCLLEDEKSRFSVFQLLEHQFCCHKPIVHSQFNDRLIDTGPEDNDGPLAHKQGGSSNQSRINTEFEFIEDIGEGAFGTVKKYRNKLDAQFYAIKKIRLNPRNKQLNKKTVREVKLLSRLNHENVVRYYNSWIETYEGLEEEQLSDSSQTSLAKTIKNVKKKDKFAINDNIEELAPPIANAKVSITYDSQSEVHFEESSSDSDSSEDDGDNNAWNNRCEDSESDGIIFEDSKDVSEKEISRDDNKSPSKSISQCLYIQMEYCEKSTLKSAIDRNLCKNESRVRRLFREILEGLAHIHKQGMIHRDLKPVNIFLDLKDHVKIGDFGLATTSLRSRLNDDITSKSTLESIKDDQVDESKTGCIGTPFYVAPELDAQSKAIYNEKVDIYSLGIILFEMCYKPPATSMERHEILQKMRQKDVIFPEDYKSTLVEKHETVIRWLLNHDVSKRPTSSELLDSKYVPPPILEEKELKDLIVHTLSNPQSKGYNHLVTSCFNQIFPPAQDITYDRDVVNTTLSRQWNVYNEFVKEVTIKIFKKHGGQNLPTPLLMPNGKCFKSHNLERNCVKVMTHDGGIVALPYDLRVPFARYIAWNHISLLRRYSIERVYREKRFYRFLPRELYECAFDIVTPSPDGFIYDGEILFIVFEIFTQLPVLKEKRIVIRLNHKLLFDAILSYYNIKDSNQTEFISEFSDWKENKSSKTEFLDYLFRLGLSDSHAQNLIVLLNSECESSKISNSFPMITKKSNTEYSKYAKNALQELETITTAAKTLGVSFDIVISPGLLYRNQLFSGMICQFDCQSKKHKHNKMDVLAVGGRYDGMIADYQNMQKGSISHKDISQSAVGISISLDKIVQIIQKVSKADDFGNFDVMVCSIGSQDRFSENVKIISSLSKVEIRWTFFAAKTIEEVEELSEESKVPHVIIVKDIDDEKVILRSREKDRVQEKTFNISDLMDEIHKLAKSPLSDQLNIDSTLLRSDSKSYVEKSQECDLVIAFHTTEKLNSAARKRLENQISSHLSDLVKQLIGQVTVLVFDLEISIIKTLAVFLEFQTSEIFYKSVTSVIEKHSKYKKVLGEICDVIYKYKFKSSKLLILYSSKDSTHIIM